VTEQPVGTTLGAGLMGVRQHPSLFYLALFLLLVISIIIALGTGPVTISSASLFAALTSSSGAGTDPTLTILDIRITRIIAAGIVGAGLSVSGAALQGMFRNPLVSSHILGITPGAGFGAAIAILLGSPLQVIALFSFLGGIGALFLTILLAGDRGISGSLMLILCGIICGALFQALTALVKYLADPADRLPSIVFWLMGSFNHLPPDLLLYVSVFIVLPAGILLAVRWQISLLSLGEEHALALGLDVRMLVLLIVIATTLIASASVAIAGMIAWVGLLVPNVVRILTGPDFRILLPASALCGAVYLICADTVARSLTFYEIPVGIITAMIGAPVLIFLIRKETGWWQ
jgi:iron complex transport system permease protein